MSQPRFFHPLPSEELLPQRVSSFCAQLLGLRTPTTPEAPKLHAPKRNFSMHVPIDSTSVLREPMDYLMLECGRSE